MRSGDWLMIWSDAALQTCLYFSSQTASIQATSHLGGPAIIVKIGSEFVLGHLLYVSPHLVTIYTDQDEVLTGN